MALNYSYRCECGNEFHKWNDIDKAGEPMPCPKCGEMARRKFGFALSKTDSSLLGRAWEKKREQKIAQELKQES
jgi:putative FmdB family regulatory protein